MLIFWSSFPVIFVWVTCRSFASGIALLKICQQREAAGVRFRGTAEVAKCRIIQDEARQSLMDHASRNGKKKSRSNQISRHPPPPRALRKVRWSAHDADEQKRKAPPSKYKWILKHLSFLFVPPEITKEYCRLAMTDSQLMSQCLSNHVSSLLVRACLVPNKSPTYKSKSVKKWLILPNIPRL